MLLTKVCLILLELDNGMRALRGLKRNQTQHQPQQNPCSLHHSDKFRDPLGCFVTPILGILTFLLFCSIMQYHKMFKSKTNLILLFQL